MKKKIHIRKALIIAVLPVLFASSSLSVAAAIAPLPSWIVATQPDVFITEIQTGTAASASEEFIELFNNTGQDIDFADTGHGGKNIWKLHYFSGSKLNPNGVIDWTKPSGSIDLSTMGNTTIGAHEYYLLAASKSDGSVYQPGGIEADGHYSAKLSDNVGLQLVDVAGATATNTVHDRLTWQKLASGPGVFSAPAAGSSLQRIPNDDGSYRDTIHGLTSFRVEPQVTPRDAWMAPSPMESHDAGIDNSASIPSPEPTVTNNTGLKTPWLTELLPNPASPQTDTNDEFIELYNPNDVGFDINGYTLETGSTTLHDFTFSEPTILAANSYRAFYSADTHLSLSNSGGQVRLLAKDKSLLSQSDTYPAAKEGQAWVLFKATWQWTGSPTPNAANHLGANTTVVGPSSPAPTPASAALPKLKPSKPAVKGVSTVRSSAGKSKAVKAKDTKSKKPKPKAAGTKQPSSGLAAVVRPTPIHAGVLAAIAVAAVLYALYEYRVDLANYCYRFRRHHPFRRKPGR